MKYQIWYDAIVNRAKDRVLTSYTENHHILPESLGGPDEAWNMVRLTAREHFICHWLLTKIYRTGEEHWKMVNALRFMRAENANQERYMAPITARVFEKLRVEYSIRKSEEMTGENNPVYKPGVREKISEAKTGVKREPFSDEWLANLSSSHVGSKNHMFEKKHKDSTKQLIREKALGRKSARKVCEHCHKDVAVNIYWQFHGEKCKEKGRSILTPA